MNPEIKTQKDTQEYWFKEGCYISEVAADQGDTEVSIARARVKPHSATAWHCLRSVAERYIIVAGTGRVELGDSISGKVESGDIVRIPPDTRQRIINITDEDLIFYVICTPPFSQECYIHME